MRILTAIWKILFNFVIENNNKIDKKEGVLVDVHVLHFIHLMNILE